MWGQCKEQTNQTHQKKPASVNWEKFAWSKITFSLFSVGVFGWKGTASRENVKDLKHFMVEASETTFTEILLDEEKDLILVIPISYFFRNCNTDSYLKPRALKLPRRNCCGKDSCFSLLSLCAYTCRCVSEHF